MKWLTKLLKIGVGVTLFCLVAGSATLYVAYLKLEPELPDVETLRDVRLQIPLKIYSSDNKLIAEFGEKHRTPLAYEDIPETLINAFLAAEDDRFFVHPGVDYQGILRAAVKLLLTGERRQGGSTITMQVARNFFLTPERTYVRKLKEIFLALRIEQELSKQEILELYLNKIYMGNRAYGVGAAAHVYYGRPVTELTLPEMAMIAGLPKAPSRYNPIANPERALLRRNYALSRMNDLGFITPEQYEEAKRAPITAVLHAAKRELEAPYVAEMVRSEVVNRFGTEAYTQGYRVYTTLESRLQEAANRAVRLALQEYDLRHGYRGPEGHLDLETADTEEAWEAFLSDYRKVGNLLPGVVLVVAERSVLVYVGKGETMEIDWEGLSWARPYEGENRRGAAPTGAGSVLKTGDLIRVLETSGEEKTGRRLAQIPLVEGILVSLKPDDGAIVSLVGGYDFYRSKYNRVTQAKRQPGSGFKAFIYSAALEAGFTAASLINDAPVVFDDPGLESAWRPENYSGKFYGPTRLRAALTHSRNLVSIRLLRAIGVDTALRHIANFGFDTDRLPRNLSLALGSGGVPPLHMANGYAVLANGGYRVEPYFIDRIEEDHQGVLYQASPLQVCRACEEEEPSPEEAAPSEAPDAPESEVPPLRVAPRAISPENHYLMNSMMQDVIKYGTGRRARVLGRSDLAGKTGTSNDQRDAWFNGFHPSLVTVTWVGFDDSRPMGRGEVGGRAALPAWIAFMREALAGVAEQPLQMPPGMVTVRIDPRTGKRAGADRQDAIFEVFRADRVPEAGPENGIDPFLGEPGRSPQDEPKDIF